MNKQLLIKILIIILIVCSILLLFMFVSNNNNSNKKETYDDYNEKIDEAVKYINVPVASQDIKEGEMFSEDNIMFITEN